MLSLQECFMSGDINSWPFEISYFFPIESNSDEIKQPTTYYNRPLLKNNTFQATFIVTEKLSRL